MNDRDVAAEGPGAQPEQARRVDEADLHALVGGLPVPQLRQHGRDARAAPGRVDDQVPGHRPFLAARRRSEADAGDPALPRRADQPGDRGVLDADVRQREHPGPDPVLQERAGAQHPAPPERHLPEVVTGQDGPHAETQVPGHRAVGGERVGEPGEQLLEDLEAPRVQDVDVTPLRHAAAGSREHGDGIAVDQGDPVVVLGEHAGGEQAGHARAQHDGVRRLPVGGGGHGVPPGVCGRPAA